MLSLLSRRMRTLCSRLLWHVNGEGQPNPHGDQADEARSIGLRVVHEYASASTSASNQAYPTNAIAASVPASSGARTTGPARQVFLRERPTVWCSLGPATLPVLGNLPGRGACIVLYFFGFNTHSDLAYLSTPIVGPISELTANTYCGGGGCHGQGGCSGISANTIGLCSSGG